MERNKFVDCLKGYACLLVVFGHVIMGIRKAGTINVPVLLVYSEEFIWTFHVALFMFLSGYVYQITGEWKKKGSRLAFIKHKALNLGVPYVVFSIVYIVINMMIPGTNHENSLTDIFRIIYRPIAQYWFLYALFLLFCYWTILSLFFNNVQITIVCVIIYYIVSLAHIPCPIIGIGLPYAITFGLGTCVHGLFVKDYSIIKKSALIICHLFVTGVFISFHIADAPIADDITEVIGICASIAVIAIVTKAIVVEKFLLFICRWSMPIYLLHTIFTAGIRIVLVKLHFYNYWGHVVIGLIFGIGVSVVVAYVTDKIPVFDFFFYPTKNMKRLSNKKS